VAELKLGCPKGLKRRKRFIHGFDAVAELPAQADFPRRELASSRLSLSLMSCDNMNISITLPQVAALAAQLPPAERKQLAEAILNDLAAPATPGRSWRDIRGAVPHPLCGEDAQDWVTRSRAESDDQRERLWRADG
jgi:hypothetical protein